MSTFIQTKAFKKCHIQLILNWEEIKEVLRLGN
jgi:hypothetical protein